MINDDTIKLLRECNAGVKMGVSSIDEVLEHVTADKLRILLVEYKDAHEKLGNRTHVLLNKYHDDEKDPHPIAKVMSWMKINMKLMQDEKDAHIADLITDGCNMGIKSLCRYLNQYKAADEESKSITKELIKIEEELMVKLRPYL